MRFVSLAGRIVNWRSLSGVADQAAWASTNFLLVVLVARSTSVAEFGLFSMGLSAYILCSALTLAVSAEVLAVTRGRALANGEHAIVVQSITGPLVGRLLLCSVVSSCVVWAATTYVPTSAPSRQIAAWLVLTVPFAVAAEGLRGVLYALTRKYAAPLVTLSWLGVQCTVSFFGVIVYGNRWEVFACAWWLGALVASLVGLRVIGVIPRLESASGADRRRVASFSVEQLASAGPAQLMVFLAGIYLGPGAAGTLRALQTVFGPLNVVLAGFRNIVIPQVAQFPSRSFMLGQGIRLGALGSVVTIGLAVVLIAVPSTGEVAFGATWSQDAGLIAAFGVGRMAVAGILGALIILRGADAFKESAHVRIVSAVVTLTTFCLGMIWSLEAAVAASSMGALIMLVVWWRLAVRHISETGTP